MRISEQIRAVRAIENLSQKELADLIGLSRPTIKNAESDQVEVGTGTIEAIKTYFAAKGYEFLPNGIVRNDNPVTYLNGESCYIQLMDDVLSSQGQGDEVLFDGADDSKSSGDVDVRMRQMADKGIKTRFLICEGNTVIKGDLNDYRWVSEEDFTENDVKVIYGENVAIYIPKGPQIMILHSMTYANDKRKDFEFKWKRSECLST